MRRILLVAALLVLSGKALTAQEPPTGQAQDQRDAATIIREYYRGTGRLPPGGEQIPGGVQQLRVDATLSSELGRLLMPLPVDLTRMLSVLPRGQQRGRIGDRVITVERSSQRIIEVIDITP